MPRAGCSTGRVLLCAAGAIKMGERSVRARERPPLEPALGCGRADTQQTMIALETLGRKQAYVSGSRCGKTRSGPPMDLPVFTAWWRARTSRWSSGLTETGCIWSSSTGTRSALGIPSGTADQRLAADPAALAARELREETGLVAARLILLGTAEVAPSMCNQLCRVYRATDLAHGRATAGLGGAGHAVSMVHPRRRRAHDQ